MVMNTNSSHKLKKIYEHYRKFNLPQTNDQHQQKQKGL